MPAITRCRSRWLRRFRCCCLRKVMSICSGEFKTCPTAPILESRVCGVLEPQRTEDISGGRPDPARNAIAGGQALALASASALALALALYVLQEDGRHVQIAANSFPGITDGWKARCCVASSIDPTFKYQHAQRLTTSVPYMQNPAAQ